MTPVRPAWETWVINNPWIILIGFLLTIVSVAIAIIFYFKGKKYKRLSYSTWSNTLIYDSVSQIGSLDIQYDKKPIDNLTTTVVTIWNAGTDTIEPTDFPEDLPLEIKAKHNCKILAAGVLHSPNKSNHITTVLANNGAQAIVSFCYLDKNDGFVIQIHHTGNSTDIDVSGYIKGSGCPVRRLAVKITEKRLDYAYALVSCIVIICYVALPDKYITRTFTTFLGIIALLMILGRRWLQSNKVYMLDIPNNNFNRDNTKD